jgi:alpha,alpha-trehalase
MIPILKDSSKINLNKKELNEALDFINDHWKQLKFKHGSDAGSLIGLPHPYIVPSVDKNSPFSFKEQYYWDSFFIALGLQYAKKQTLVEGMLENLLYLLNRFEMIPNANRMYFLSRSQPPILTTYIFHVYDTYNKSPEWLADHIEQAKHEYHKVWMSEVHPHWRRVYKGLSRYYDINVLHDLAEAESGWDMTPRFERKCLDFLPIDLNALLYKYEMDFSRAAEIAGNKRLALEWHAVAKERKEAVDELMWSKLKGFYFDYNYNKRARRDTWSLAGYYAMWVGMATEKQAEQMVQNLGKFEQKGGLTTTTRPLIDMSIFGSLKTQWAYPNGWAPLHFIVVEGLKRYGYEKEAERIAKKWLQTNLDWFTKHNEFLEKYNVVKTKSKPLDGVYPGQSGFGWTNGVFTYFAHEYSAKQHRK